MSNSKLSRTELAAEVGTELRRLAAEVETFDERAARGARLNRTDVRCLGVLRARGPLRSSELAAAVGLSSGGLSIALARLERAGRIRRTPDPTDRRGVIVEATDTSPVPNGEDRVRRLAGGFRKDELELVRRFLRETRAALQAP